MTRRSEIDAKLQAIYDQIPEVVNCKGHCWMSCGPVPMSDREQQRLRERGYKVTDLRSAKARTETFWCEALTGDGKCGAYEQRPAMCRAWGVSEMMPCPYGCVPEKTLSDDDTFRLMLESLAAGGAQNLGQDIRPEDIPEILEARRRAREPLGRLMDAHKGDQIRVAEHGTTIPPEVAKRKKLKTQR
jgi:Fe-S-cluster containining protein